jgi:hypothetical protein
MYAWGIVSGGHHHFNDTIEGDALPNPAISHIIFRYCLMFESLLIVYHAPEQEEVLARRLPYL